MTTRRIEITEDVLRDGRTVYHRDDVITVDAGKASEWIRLGWARDPETGEQGERKPGAHRINVHSINQDQQ